MELIPVDALTTMQEKCTLDAQSVSGGQSFFSWWCTQISVPYVSVWLRRYRRWRTIPLHPSIQYIGGKCTKSVKEVGCITYLMEPPMESGVPAPCLRLPRWSFLSGSFPTNHVRDAPTIYHSWSSHSFMMQDRNKGDRSMTGSDSIVTWFMGWSDIPSKHRKI